MRNVIEATRPEGLTELEQKCLQFLSRRGPALPVQLAARTYSFLDEITPVIRDLEQRGLVKIERVYGTHRYDLIRIAGTEVRR